MDFLHHKKFVCEKDNEKFETYEELIAHSRHIHHMTILKCDGCGKEFIQEKDRLHHVREEHEKELAQLLNKKLIEKSLYMAKEITKNSYNAIKASKYLINKGMDMDIDSGLRMEIYGWALCFAHEDRINRMSAFLNKSKKK